jgi:hypothetical protein
MRRVSPRSLLAPRSVNVLPPSPDSARPTVVCSPCRSPQPITEGENRMAGFLFRLELEGGTPADPPTFATAVPTWRPGDTIPPGRSMLSVIGVRDDDADRPPVLVVEELQT